MRAATSLRGVFRQGLFWLRAILRFDSCENPPSALFASFIARIVALSFSGSLAQRFRFDSEAWGRCLPLSQPGRLLRVGGCFTFFNTGKLPGEWSE
jgi:hypothetical protein